MNILNIFLPHFLLLVVLWRTISLIRRLVRSRRIQTQGTCAQRVIACPGCISLILSILLSLIILCLTPIALAQILLRAEPTADQDADTAIILGFGYEMDGATMNPGAANEYLLDWTIRNTSVTTIIVQEGVWVAAECDRSADTCTMSIPSGRTIQVVRMHRHDADVYVNTFEAAMCAIEKMKVLGKHKAILVAHDLQLERAAWDFEYINRAYFSSAFTFVVPQMPDTPYPSGSKQLHTRYEFVYASVELFWSRPRDFGRPVVCQLACD